MKKHALKGLWGITLLALLVSACGGDSSGPSQGLAPDVAGRFTDPWFWTIELRRVSDGQATALRCAGSLWISQNTGASAIGQLTGSAVVDEPCRPFSFDLTGLAWPDGRLELTTNGPPGALACSPAVAVQYRGQISAARLEAEAEAVLQCPDGEYTASYRIEGARVTS